MLEDKSIGQIASTLIVLRNRQAIIDDFSAEISAYLKDNSIFDYLEWEYSESENDKLKNIDTIEKLDEDIKIKVFSDWFCSYLHPFSYDEILDIIEYFSFGQRGSLIRRNCEILSKSISCRVCGYPVHEQDAAFEICPICYWQHDTSTLNQASLTNTDEGGLPLNIKKAKELFKLTGNSEGKPPKPISILVREVHDVVRNKDSRSHPQC